MGENKKRGAAKRADRLVENEAGTAKRPSFERKFAPLDLRSKAANSDQLPPWSLFPLETDVCPAHSREAV